jgi:predicted patatin/cPLA2 family phospholipase
MGTMTKLGHQIITPGADHALIDRLREKQRLLAAGDPDHKAIRTALIIGGGGMRGVYSTGITAGLEAIGMGDIFDDAIGISAGACAVAYLLAGQAAVGPSVYYDDLTNKKFISLLRPKNIMDINFMEHVFRDVKPLNQAVVRKARSHMYVGLTEVVTGKGFYLNMEKYPELDIVSTIVTSSAIPGVAKQQPAINGVLYADGTTGCTSPIDYTIEELGATDILVILNYYPLSNRAKLPASERLLDKVLLRKYSKDLRMAQVNRLSNHNFKADKSYADHVNIGVLCPEREFVTTLSKDSRALKSLADRATAEVSAIFG